MPQDRRCLRLLRVCQGFHLLIMKYSDLCGLGVWVKNVHRVVSVFSDHRQVNLCLRVWLDGVLGGYKGLYWFGWNVPTSSSLLLVLPAFGLQ